MKTWKLAKISVMSKILYGKPCRTLSRPSTRTTFGWQCKQRSLNVDAQRLNQNWQNGQSSSRLDNLKFNRKLSVSKEVGLQSQSPFLEGLQTFSRMCRELSLQVIRCTEFSKCSLVSTLPWVHGYFVCSLKCLRHLGRTPRMHGGDH